MISTNSMLRDISENNDIVKNMLKDINEQLEALHNEGEQVDDEELRESRTQQNLKSDNGNLFFQVSNLRAINFDKLKFHKDH